MNKPKPYLLSSGIEASLETSRLAQYIAVKTNKLKQIMSDVGPTSKYSNVKLRNTLEAMTPKHINFILVTVPVNFKGNLPHYSQDLLDTCNLYKELYKLVTPKFIDVLSNIQSGKPASIFDTKTKIDLKSHLKVAKYHQGDGDVVALSKIISSKASLVDLLMDTPQYPLDAAFLTRIESDVKVISTLTTSIGHSLSSKVTENQRRTLKYVSKEVHGIAELISIIGSLAHQVNALEYSLGNMKEHIMTL
jgi:hypothetical protein